MQRNLTRFQTQLQEATRTYRKCRYQNNDHSSDLDLKPFQFVVNSFQITKAFISFGRCLAVDSQIPPVARAIIPRTETKANPGTSIL